VGAGVGRVGSFSIPGVSRVGRRVSRRVAAGVGELYPIEYLEYPE
jgi:hypothetical protein